MEDLKDGIMSGGFEIAGASNVRQCSDLGVRSVMRIRPGYNDTRERS